MTLEDRLRRLRDSAFYPMHMPGHKRNTALLHMDNPYGLDITEIDGFDNLHEAEGILSEGMNRAARLYGSGRCFYLVNGSTGGLLAGIAACTTPGDAVLVARNCHRAVYHALALRGLRPVYLLPPVDETFGIAGSVPPGTVERLLSERPNIRLAVITSPTYEGVLSDVASIAATAHAHGVPLLVDEAHGAHLGFSPAFAGGAVRAGADIVVQSLHKTLPALTQTGLLHVNGGLVDGERVRRELAIFETSSPSYLLMASADNCVRLLETEGEALFSAYEARLRIFDGQMDGLRHLRVLGKGGDRVEAHPAVFALDPGKIVISARGTGRGGPALLQILREEHGLELEMAAGDYAVAMTSICDTAEGFDRLAAALLTVDAQLSSVPSVPSSPFPDEAEPVMLIGEAENRPAAAVPLEESVGKIAAEYVWMYPPGIPLLVPGERVSAALPALLKKQMEAGLLPHSTSGLLPEMLRVIEKE